MSPPFLPSTIPPGRRAARPACALFLVLLCCAGATAMPLDQYKSRLHEAALALDEIWETEAATEAEYAEKMAAAFAQVRRLVPTSEVVEWEGGRVEVNNAWLDDEARAFERLPAGGTERTQLLSRVSQRLIALEERAEELGGGPPAAGGAAKGTGAASKGQEKARMEAILRRREFDETPPEKTWLERLWEQIKRWWGGLFGGGGGFLPGQSS